MSSPGIPVSQWCVNRPWSDEAIDCEGRQARSGCDWSRRFIAALQWTEAPAAINPPLGRAMPPNGRTSALGEGPARDWQIYVSRGSQGTAAAQAGRPPSWSAAQTFLADGIPSLREQECCDDPVSHCPAGGATAMQPAKEPMEPEFRRNCRRGLSCSSLPACAYNTRRQARRAKLDESRKQTCLLLGGVNVSAALEVQKANPQSPQSGLKKVAAGIRGA